MHKAYGLFLGLALLSGPALATPTDLSSWTKEGPGYWALSSDKHSVTQALNGDPTVFYSDFNGRGTSLSGTIKVNTAIDDDFIGFVLGFKPGDLASSTTNFILIDWKQANQNLFGCTGSAGLSISSVSSGLSNNAGAWCHSAANGVTELARATTLGNTGWLDNTEYSFKIDFTKTKIKVSVNGNLELDVNGNFADGRFGFYNYSQPSVIYGAIDDAVIPVPEPATWAMLVTGFGFAGSALRRRRRELRETPAH